MEACEGQGRFELDMLCLGWCYMLVAQEDTRGDLLLGRRNLHLLSPKCPLDPKHGFQERLEEVVGDYFHGWKPVPQRRQSLAQDLQSRIQEF